MDSNEKEVLWGAGRVLLVGVLTVVALALAAPWLRATIGDSMLRWVGAVAAILIAGYSFYFMIQSRRKLDEVQKAAIAFSMEWGMPVGICAFALLLLLPQFHSFAANIVRGLVNAPLAAMDQHAIGAAMGLGFAVGTLLQAAGMMLFGVIWWISKR